MELQLQQWEALRQAGAGTPEYSPKLGPVAAKALRRLDVDMSTAQAAAANQFGQAPAAVVLDKRQRIRRLPYRYSSEAQSIIDLASATAEMARDPLRDWEGDMADHLQELQALMDWERVPACTWALEVEVFDDGSIAAWFHRGAEREPAYSLPDQGGEYLDQLEALPLGRYAWRNPGEGPWGYDVCRMFFQWFDNVVRLQECPGSVLLPPERDMAGVRVYRAALPTAVAVGVQQMARSAA